MGKIGQRHFPSCNMYLLCIISGIPKSGGAFNHMTAGLLTHIMRSGELEKLIHQIRTENEVNIYTHIHFEFEKSYY